MTVRKVAVDLFYDVASPYSWITFEALTRYKRYWGNMDLRLNPILLGAVFKAVKAKAPPPALSRYTKNDLRLLADYYNLPFRRPKDLQHVIFEKGSLQPQRLLTAASASSPQFLEALSRELFMRIWVKDLDATTADSLTSACQTVGLSEREGIDLVALTKTADTKEKLKDTSTLALEYGAFGAPTYVVHLENGPVMLFGSDRLFILAHLLNNRWPGPLNDMNQVKLT